MKVKMSCKTSFLLTLCFFSLSSSTSVLRTNSHAGHVHRMTTVMCNSDPSPSLSFTDLQSMMMQIRQALDDQVS